MPSTDKSPFYQRTYTCLLDEGAFTAFRMYPSKIKDFEKYDEYLDIPYYADSPEGVFGNLLFQEVQVCPTCGFASNEESMFRSESKFVKPVTLDAAARRHLLAGASDRLHVLGTVSTLYELPRSVDDALRAYHAGLLSSQALYELDRERFVNELLRAANYCLKAGRLCREAERPGTEVEWLYRALGCFDQILVSDAAGTTRYRALYQQQALAIMLGEDKAASLAYTTIVRLANELGDAELQKYLNRARTIWQDRKEHQAQRGPDALK